VAPLINCQSLSKSFGVRTLFEGLSITVSEGECIGLIGPNGAGKSTLLQILAGLQSADSGEIAVRKLARICYVPQESRFEPGTTVGSYLAHGDEAVIPVTMGRAGFTDPSVSADTLSGGWKKRLAIAGELVRAPDLLLLDEPTNHLDLDGILWLERLVKSETFASVIISHDRYFLENVASDIVEINRVYPEGLLRVRGAYSEFLLKREEFLAAQAKQLESLANIVAREVEWLRRGPKARTSKSRARIDEAGRLIDQLADAESRAAKSTATIDFTATDRKTKRLLVAESVTKGELFRNLNCTLTPGSRLGLVGPNGSGKTTLLRIFKGELEPDNGEIRRADGLRIVYFDQNREQLDPNTTLRRALAPHGDSIMYRDRPIHVAGWAKRFLFHNEQLEMPVSQLSGGEKARVHIAKLMLQPADLLMLDEPTNDLDIDTLSVLEESLLEFPGALVLVTHDRYMLDRVSTAVLGLDGSGNWGMFADYSQWEQARQEAAAPPKEAKPADRRPSQTPPKKLSYMESREFEQMEDRIHAAEADLAAKQRALEDPEIMRDARKLQQAYDQQKAAEEQVGKLYERWAELESKRVG
jgi:ATP-binding cassette subfamily F protein uup